MLRKFQRSWSTVAWRAAQRRAPSACVRMRAALQPLLYHRDESRVKQHGVARAGKRSARFRGAAAAAPQPSVVSPASPCAAPLWGMARAAWSPTRRAAPFARPAEQRPRRVAPKRKCEAAPRACQRQVHWRALARAPRAKTRRRERISNRPAASSRCKETRARAAQVGRNRTNDALRIGRTGVSRCRDLRPPTRAHESAKYGSLVPAPICAQARLVCA